MSTDNTGYPTVLEFQGLGPCYYTIHPFARPKRGEWYWLGEKFARLALLTGVLPEARIVRPTFHAIATTVWVMGPPIIPEEVRGYIDGDIIDPRD